MTGEDLSWRVACDYGPSGHCAHGRHDTCAHRPGGPQEHGSEVPAAHALTGPPSGPRSVLADVWVTCHAHPEDGPDGRRHGHVWRCPCPCHTAKPRGDAIPPNTTAAVTAGAIAGEQLDLFTCLAGAVTS